MMVVREENRKKETANRKNQREVKDDRQHMQKSVFEVSRKIQEQ